MIRWLPCCGFRDISTSEPPACSGGSPWAACAVPRKTESILEMHLLQIKRERERAYSTIQRLRMRLLSAYHRTQGLVPVSTLISNTHKHTHTTWQRAAIRYETGCIWRGGQSVTNSRLCFSHFSTETGTSFYLFSWLGGGAGWIG